MRTPTTIANMACDWLDLDPLHDLETSQSAHGRYLRRNYSESVDTVLREFPWNCATTRVTLDKIDPPEGWQGHPTGYPDMYAWPSDCMRPVDFNDRPCDEINWTNETVAITDGNGTVVSRKKVLLLDDRGWYPNEPIILRYVARIDPAEMDPHLAKAISLELAIRCVNKANNSTSKLQVLEDEYKKATTGDNMRKGGFQLSSRENNAKPPRQSYSTGAKARAGLV